METAVTLVLGKLITGTGELTMRTDGVTMVTGEITMAVMGTAGACVVVKLENTLEFVLWLKIIKLCVCVGGGGRNGFE